MAERESVLREFTNGTTIKWSRLTTVVLGVFSASFFGPIADFILNLFRTTSADPLTGLGAFYGRVIGVIGTGLEDGISASWRQATALVSDFGVLAFITAILLVGAVAVIAMQWRRFT